MIGRVGFLRSVVWLARVYWAAATVRLRGGAR